MMYPKNILSWLLAITLSLVASTGLVSLHGLYQEVNLSEKRLHFLEREEERLVAELDALHDTKQRMEDWRTLVKKIQAAQVDTDHWLIYPLNISQSMTQEDLVSFLKKMGSDSQLPVADQKYWLMPDEITIRQSIKGQGQEAHVNDTLDFDFSGKLIVYSKTSDNERQQAQ